MKISAIALVMVLASLSGLAGATPLRAGSCSHCVFDDDQPKAGAPARCPLSRRRGRHRPGKAEVAGRGDLARQPRVAPAS